MKEIKMIVLDCDGIIFKTRWTEKTWRWLAAKIKIKRAPKILLSLQEIIEMFFDIKPNFSEEEVGWQIKEISKKYLVGLLTDRSLRSIHFLFSSANKISKHKINFDDFSFIQTREGLLEKFIADTKTLPRGIYVSKKTKPHIATFENLKKFADGTGMLYDEILIFDDSPQMNQLAISNGFLTRSNWNLPPPKIIFLP